MNSKLITQEEAKEILFNESDVDERDKKSLEDEIKFLRELVEKLSNSNNSTIIEKIKYIEKPYYQTPWYKQYDVWCGGSINDNKFLCSETAQNCNFNNIKTF